ncbi:MAG TPA: glutamate formimidoyltransferase [Acidimicrobiia bacterium]|nr:glutamate formimidoyltransferase [Acidimicrobiia bacterium]
MLECVVNLSEGRNHDIVDAIAGAAGAAVLDVHVDADHNRAVVTLGGEPVAVEDATRRLARRAVSLVDLRVHEGVHPRFGVVDVVPFVALHDTPSERATHAARAYARWSADTLGVPVFLYGDADPRGRTLPDARRDAFTRRAPDVGPVRADPRRGATAVGARPVLVALNCDLANDDVALARTIAGAVRERDGGLPGVRALGLALTSRGCAQVSMNLVDLDRTGVEAACRAVRELAVAHGSDVARVELVGLVPAAEVARWSDEFRAWSAISDGQTIEARLARAGDAERSGGPAAAGGA